MAALSHVNRWLSAVADARADKCDGVHDLGAAALTVLIEEHVPARHESCLVESLRAVASEGRPACNNNVSASAVEGGARVGSESLAEGRGWVRHTAGAVLREDTS